MIRACFNFKWFNYSRLKEPFDSFKSVVTRTGPDIELPRFDPNKYMLKSLCRARLLRGSMPLLPHYSIIQLRLGSTVHASWVWTNTYLYLYIYISIYLIFLNPTSNLSCHTKCSHQHLLEQPVSTCNYLAI
jgi:hypothetical protein